MWSLECPVLAVKADHALALGLNLMDVTSWVGWSQGVKASDVHNMVPAVCCLTLLEDSRVTSHSSGLVTG